MLLVDGDSRTVGSRSLWCPVALQECLPVPEQGEHRWAATAAGQMGPDHHPISSHPIVSHPAAPPQCRSWLRRVQAVGSSAARAAARQSTGGIWPLILTAPLLGDLWARAAPALVALVPPQPAPPPTPPRPILSGAPCSLQSPTVYRALSMAFAPRPPLSPVPCRARPCPGPHLQSPLPYRVDPRPPYRAPSPTGSTPDSPVEPPRLQGRAQIPPPLRAPSPTGPCPEPRARPSPQYRAALPARSANPAGCPGAARGAACPGAAFHSTPRGGRPLGEGDGRAVRADGADRTGRSGSSARGGAVPCAGSATGSPRRAPRARGDARAPSAWRSASRGGGACGYSAPTAAPAPPLRPATAPCPRCQPRSFLLRPRSRHRSGSGSTVPCPRSQPCSGPRFFLPYPRSWSQPRSRSGSGSAVPRPRCRSLSPQPRSQGGDGGAGVRGCFMRAPGPAGEQGGRGAVIAGSGRERESRGAGPRGRPGEGIGDRAGLGTAPSPLLVPVPRVSASRGGDPGAAPRWGTRSPVTGPARGGTRPHLSETKRGEGVAGGGGARGAVALPYAWGCSGCQARAPSSPSCAPSRRGP